MHDNIPATFSLAIATEPLWLRAWVGLLVVTNLTAVGFLIGKESTGWKFRAAPAAILVSFFAAAAFMNWLYIEVGYVRLLGIGHLLFWLPVWCWLVYRRKDIGRESLYGKYIHLYLLIAGISLFIDSIDVIRFLLGDGALLNRWQ